MGVSQNHLTDRSVIRGKNRALICAALLGSTMIGGQVYAQSSAGAFEEIVVTAQKRSQSINDVGMTINAFTSNQLNNYGVQSMDDMAVMTPGLTISDTAATGVPIYTIRGVGFTDYSTAASSTVGIYFDEVAIPYAVMSRGTFFDVERIEVLKGPQGDLYGRNTTAGQINFISRKPTSDFEAGMDAGYERFDILDLEGYVSGPLTDNVRARLAVKARQSLSDSGWQKSITRPDDRLGEEDVLAARGILDMDLNENINLMLNLHWIRDKSDNTATTAYDGQLVGLPTQALPTIGTPPFQVGEPRLADWTPGIYRPQRDNELKGVNAKLQWDFDGVILTSVTGYDKFDRAEWNDWDGSPFRDSNNLNETNLEVFSEELRLSSDNDSDLSWIVGAYYSWDKMDETYNYFMNESFYSLALGIQTLDTAYEQKTESIAGFAHVEWQFAHDWRLTLGARYTEEDREWSGCTYDTGDGTLAGGLNNIITPFFILPLGLPDPGLVQPGECGVYDDRPDSPTYGTFAVFSDDISTNKWMWKVGIDHNVTDDLLAYATLSTGFKSGGFNGANANTHAQLVPYGPEELTSIELGMKSTLMDGRMQFNLAGFWYDYKDKQEQMDAITFVGAISGLTNVPKSRIKGAELEMRWLVTEGLTFDFGAAWLDTTIKKWMAVDGNNSTFGNVVFVDASGQELANSPEWQLNGTVTYEWPVSDGLMAMVAADGSYQDSTTGGVRPEDATEDYFLANARIGIRDMADQWDVTLWMRNVFNEYYYPAAFQGGNGPWVRVNGMPRTWGVRLGYRF
jgi:iron complex outermembrane receptor protein